MGTSHLKIWILFWIWAIGTVGVIGYSKTPKQYHIQTDEGPDRYFRYQTYNGQYRKEKRFDDGTVVGTYGWVDPTGLLRLYDYIADHLGYRIVRQRTLQVPLIVEPPPPSRPQPVVRPEPVTHSPEVTRPQPLNWPPTTTRIQPLNWSPTTARPQSENFPPVPAQSQPVAWSPTTARPQSENFPPVPAQSQPVAWSSTTARPQPLNWPPTTPRPQPVAWSPTTAQPQPVNFPPGPPRPQPVAWSSTTARPQPVNWPPLTTPPQKETRPSSISQHRPVAQPQPEIRPVTHHRPSTILRPVPQPVRVTNAIQVPQGSARPKPKPTLVREKPPKFRPILIPLSPTGSLIRPVVELQPALPALPDQRLRPVEQVSPKATSSHLLPHLKDTSFQKVFTGSPSENSSQDPTTTTTTTTSFKTAGPSTEDLTLTRNNLGGRRRFRGRPIASQRVPSLGPGTRTSANRGRGSIRFNGDQQSIAVNQRRRSQLLHPTTHTQNEDTGTSAGGFGAKTTSLDSPRSTSDDRRDRNKNRINNSIRRQKSESDSNLSTNFNSAGDLTSQKGITNPDATFDLPPDLPYSINYDLGNQFHLEKILPDGTKVGKHGYVDPLGVLRVTHYSTGPNGHQTRLDNRWVGARHPEEHV